MCEPAFAHAVAQAIDRPDCCQPGIQALSRSHRRSIRVPNTRDLAGSVNLDDCLHDAYPEDARWDYAIGCTNRLLVFVEVHGYDISGIARKKDWLSQFLQSHGRALVAWARSQVYYWVPTPRASVPRQGSRDYNRLREKGIKIAKNKTVSPECS